MSFDFTSKRIKRQGIKTLSRCNIYDSVVLNDSKMTFLEKMGYMGLLSIYLCFLNEVLLYKRIMS